MRWLRRLFRPSRRTITDPSDADSVAAFLATVRPVV